VVAESSVAGSLSYEVKSLDDDFVNYEWTFTPDDSNYETVSGSGMSRM
jgi:hypothetical protein